ncbi:MAG: hypothetical protein RI897_1323 [Verrucomicrobiota bacterium]
MDHRGRGGKREWLGCDCVLYVEALISGVNGVAGSCLRRAWQKIAPLRRVSGWWGGVG